MSIWKNSAKALSSTQLNGPEEGTSAISSSLSTSYTIDQYLPNTFLHITSAQETPRLHGEEAVIEKVADDKTHTIH